MQIILRQPHEETNLLNTQSPRYLQPHSGGNCRKIALNLQAQYLWPFCYFHELPPGLVNLKHIYRLCVWAWVTATCRLVSNSTNKSKGAWLSMAEMKSQVFIENCLNWKVAGKPRGNIVENDNLVVMKGKLNVFLHPYMNTHTKKDTTSIRQQPLTWKHVHTKAFWVRVQQSTGLKGYVNQYKVVLGTSTIILMSFWEIGTSWGGLSASLFSFLTQGMSSLRQSKDQPWQHFLIGRLWESCEWGFV